MGKWIDLLSGILAALSQFFRSPKPKGDDASDAEQIPVDPVVSNLYHRIETAKANVDRQHQEEIKHDEASIHAGRRDHLDGGW